MRSRSAARAALGLTALSAASIGLIAAAAPHSFYADFPFFAHWVEMLPPYNEHLVTDVGGLYLGFALLFSLAALKPEPTLVRAACAAWLLSQSLHLVFHATHLEGFGAVDGAAELASLALLLAPAGVALWAVAPSDP